MAKRSPPGGALTRSRQKALTAARWAASSSSAYRQILQEHGVSAADLAADIPLQRLPVLTKDNTFGRFPLAELARPVRTTDLADVLTSSGRSGRHFGFRLTERSDHENSWFWIDLGLEDAFRVDTLPTLLVNCLPMGVVFRSRAVTVANVSVREDMACAILRDVGSRFAQTVLCTDPLFIRRLLDHGEAVGVDWRALNTSVIIGEEMLVEEQRDHIAVRMGIDLDREPHRLVASSFGVGELGLNLLFESRETIRIRRAARQNTDLAELIAGRAAPGAPLAGVFCYNPQATFIEVLNPGDDGFGELCFTLLGRHAVIPLPRFATGDLGRLLSPAESARAAQLAGTATPWLPMVLVRGRISDHGSGQPAVEAVKSLLYRDERDARRLTGAFLIETAAETGAAKILVQAVDRASAHDTALQQRLDDQAAVSWPGARVVLVEPEQFPGRPLLDFERKLNYVGKTKDQPAHQAGALT